MPQIKYVGLKMTGEQAFIDDTKLEWFPGDSHEVSAAHAEKMLKHPDVFALADAPVGLADAKPVAVPPHGNGNDAPPPANKPGTTIHLPDPDNSLLDLAGMDKAALQALAKAHSVTFHHSHGAPKLIELLQAAFPVKPE